MQNAGFVSTRNEIAQKLTNESKSSVNSDDILITTGAAGAINVILHSILDQNDEVIIFKPYFPEYKFYVDNHGGKSVYCEFNEDFTPSIESLNSIISDKTKAIIFKGSHRKYLQNCFFCRRKVQIKDFYYKRRTI
jgi:aspartate aminotransferase